MAICIYPQDCVDFSTNGLGVLTPTEATVNGADGMWTELTVTQPIDKTLRWALLEPGCILKAPAPTRESPLYEQVEDITEGETRTVTREVYVVRVNSRLRLRAAPSTSAAILDAYGNGTKVIKLGTASGGWMQVCVQSGGRVGWMSDTYLSYDGSYTETISQQHVVGSRVVEYRQSRDQLWRVYKVDPIDSAAGTVTAHAQPIAYDIGTCMIDEPWVIETPIALGTALSQMWAKVSPTPDVQLHIAAGLDTEIEGDYGWKNPIEAMMDPDEGMLVQGDAMLVMDNFDLFVLPKGERKSGVTVRRGKNLQGVKITRDISGVVTRLVPVGKTKDGEPWYLQNGDGPKSRAVDSPHIGDYPFPRTQKLDVDVQIVDADPDHIKTFTNWEESWRKMRELVQAEYDAGADLPTYGMDVEFVQIPEGDEEGAQYAALQSVYLGDTVTVIDSLVGLRADLRAVEAEYDILAGQYVSLKLGDVTDVSQTVYSYQLPTGGVSGTKIAPGSLDGGAVRSGTFQYLSASQAMIESLKADAIQAVAMDINAITAGTITTDTLAAALAHVTELVAGTIQATSGEFDALTAAVAKLARAEVESAAIENADILALKSAVATVATAYIDWAYVVSQKIGTATIDHAKIGNAVVGQLITADATQQRVFIERLQVLSAQLAKATIGELVVKAADDHYYRLDVSAAGAVTATDVTEDLTPAEIQAGVTSDGRGSIIETSLTVEDLAAGDLKAINALIDHITADRIDAGVLFARQAVVNEVYTQIINGLDASGVNQRIELNSQGIAAAVESVDGLSTRVAQTESDLALKVNASDVEAWARYSVSGGEGTLELGQKDSRYTTETSPTGFRVKQDGQDMTTMVRGRVAAPVFEVKRQIEIGNYSVRADAEGGVLFI